MFIAFVLQLKVIRFESQTICRHGIQHTQMLSMKSHVAAVTVAVAITIAVYTKPIVFIAECDN